MKFLLIYDGRLKGKAPAVEKNFIREALDRQMRLLWNQPPLDSYKHYLPGGQQENASPFIFPPPVTSPSCPSCICLVTSKAFFIAEVNITLLRPDPPGSFVHSGDIDNRMKTLIDALRRPKTPEEFKLNKGEKFLDHLYCVLEDDNLISRLSVSTERLLVPVEDQLNVVALIRVNVKMTRDTIAFMGVAIAT